MSEIEGQIARLRDPPYKLRIPVGARRVMNEAADTMERMLAVIKAAEYFEAMSSGEDAIRAFLKALEELEGQK